MVDKHTKAQRSYNMSRIRSKNTKIELLFKSLLKGTYLRYQPKMYGNPDFGSKKHKIVVFIDGCFWHKCPKCYIKPKSNRKFWSQKANKNAARDKSISKVFKQQNYIVFRFWQHQIIKDGLKYAKKIHKEVKKEWKN